MSVALVINDIRLVWGLWEWLQAQCIKRYIPSEIINRVPAGIYKCWRCNRKEVWQHYNGPRIPLPRVTIPFYLSGDTFSLYRRDVTWLSLGTRNVRQAKIKQTLLSVVSRKVRCWDPCRMPDFVTGLPWQTKIQVNFQSPKTQISLSTIKSCFLETFDQIGF